jgi:hypothetical protein
VQEEVGSDADYLKIEAATVEKSMEMLIVLIVSSTPRRPESTIFGRH